MAEIRGLYSLQTLSSLTKMTNINLFVDIISHFSTFALIRLTHNVTAIPASMHTLSQLRVVMAVCGLAGLKTPMEQWAQGVHPI